MSEQEGMKIREAITLLLMGGGIVSFTYGMFHDWRWLAIGLFLLILGGGIAVGSTAERR